MSFKDLDQIFKVRPIKLPIKGKTYSFPGTVSARTGLLLHRMTEMAEAASSGKEDVELDQEVLDDTEHVDLRREVLGEAEREMINDEVPSVFVEHAFRTLICWHQFGEEIAEKVWEDVPGAPKAKPQDRKPKSRKATSAGATTTRKQDSSSTTSESGQASVGDESSASGA